MVNQRKIDIVKNISDKLARAKSFVLTDYRGLTHKQLEQLKKSLKRAQAEFLVIKNTLLVKAMTEANLAKSEELKTKQEFNGPTAVLFSYADEITPLKILAKFIKTLSLPKIKLGFLDNKELSVAEVNRLITLPTRDVLLNQLVGWIKSPLFGLHRALSWNTQRLVLVLGQIKQNKPK